jgi:hypothetical protein
MFDLVIVLGPNDYEFFNDNFHYNITNIIGYNEIYIITDNSNFKLNLKNYDCNVKINIINEEIFDFNKETLKKIKNIKTKRYGWYFQQLLKLYFHKICKQPYYLVVDADTLFLKKTKFFDSSKPLYNTGTENHRPYFKHIQEFIPIIKRESGVSGICHHMLFSVEIVKEIFNYVELKSKNSFYYSFIECINNNEFCKSGASEYEIYFNYILRYHKDNIKIRKLKWNNVPNLLDNHKYIYDYVSIHHYLR